MPVTAKLSRQFYHRLGEQVANELVDWFNAVDTAYRTELREFNELNFARFDAKLDQRLAEYSARFETKLEQFKAELNTKVDRVAAELSTLRAELKAEWKADLQSLKAELIKWMFVFWAGTALAGLLLR